MKIKNIRIENFRGFEDPTISLNQYSCFVGPNGAGKSTVLAALNVFFQDKSAGVTDTTRLIAEDFFRKRTEKPVRITVTFDSLPPEAIADLSDYVRHGELTVTAEAAYNPQQNVANVRILGSRKVIEDFRVFFDADKAGASPSELSVIYDQLRQRHPDLLQARAKGEKISTLRKYEEAHPEKCADTPSDDEFYGIQGINKLSPFVQWIYVPAVKDAVDEGQEAKNTSLGKLITRVVRSKTTFDADIETLKSLTIAKYAELLDKNKGALSQLASSLQQRLGAWAHSGARLEMDWLADPKSVVVQAPVAGIKTGEGDFLGSLVRMGHGLQRSYLLALLQELANSDSAGAPTLILGCEEPELYQHPPQARHLADVFEELAVGNNQILITTHSPLFVSGEGFENVRLVRRPDPNAGAKVTSVEFKDVCSTIRQALAESPKKRTEGLIAKIHQTLQPGVAEMFFARVPVLVEGLEDVSYITAELILSKKWSDFRRFGCHLIPVNKKSNLIQPLAIAKLLGMRVFVVFDADGDAKDRNSHERDNKALIDLLGSTSDPFPAQTFHHVNHTIWPTNIGAAVTADCGVPGKTLATKLEVKYGHEGDLYKNGMFIADWLSSAHDQGIRSPSLASLCDQILRFAQSV